MPNVFTNVRAFAEGSSSLEYAANGELSPDDVRIAITAILTRVACEDNHFSSAELASLVSCLGAEFDIPETSVGELLDVARLLSNHPEKHKELADRVVEHFNVDQRERILAILWRVILADGTTSSREATVAASIRTHLGLTMEQALRARKLAELGEIGPLAQALAVDANE